MEKGGRPPKQVIDGLKKWAKTHQGHFEIAASAQIVHRSGTCFYAFSE
jgi:hypothetical protein